MHELLVKCLWLTLFVTKFLLCLFISLRPQNSQRLPLVWEGTYTKLTGGILTVQSELGELIYKVVTWAVKLWKEFDNTSYQKESESCGLQKLLGKWTRTLQNLGLDGRRMVALLSISVIWHMRRQCWGWLGWHLSCMRNNGLITHWGRLVEACGDGGGMICGCKQRRC